MPSRLPRSPARVVYGSRMSVQKVAGAIAKHLEDRGFRVGPLHTQNVGGDKMSVLSVTVPDEPWGALEVGAQIVIDPKTYGVTVEDYGRVSIRAEVEGALKDAS
jgi:hypothetical protein